MRKDFLASKAAFLLIIWMMTPAAIADDLSMRTLLSDYDVTAGLSVQSIDFDVGPIDGIQEYGVLSEDFSYTPFITIGSPYRFFGDSKWGNFMEYGISGFSLSKQNVNGQLADLGTSARGLYAFVTPTLFYSFTDKSNTAQNQGASIVGLGVGIGYLKAKGDIIFTETTMAKHEFDIEGAAIAVSIFIDYRRGNFVTRITGEQTSLEDNGLEYDAFGFNWDFAYLF